MDKRIEIIESIGRQGILPLYYEREQAESLQIANALYQSGVRALEYTNRGQEAARNFKALRQLCDDQLPGLFLGAGTIKDATAARIFLDAGADFLVSPGLAEDVYDITYSEKILWIPGCMSVTEILKAEQFGLQLIKLFPAQLLGVGFLEAVREIFPNLLFLPTGGVGTAKEHLSRWYAAGAFAVGLGSKLVSKQMTDAAGLERLQDQVRELLHDIQDLRAHA